MLNLPKKVIRETRGGMKGCPLMRTVSAWHLHRAYSEKLFYSHLVAILVRCWGLGVACHRNT